MAGVVLAAAPAIGYTCSAAGLLQFATFPGRAGSWPPCCSTSRLPYWQLYWSTFAPFRSVFPALPGTPVMSFTMPQLN